MKVIAAYLLAVLGGNASPDAAAIGKILSSVGIEADKAKVEKLIGELKGKNLEEVIAEGSKKLATMPSGGAVAPAATGAPASGAPKKEEEKKEEKKKKEEPKEEE